MRRVARRAQHKVDVIFVTGPAPLRTVAAATRSIPIVALDLETDPVRAWLGAVLRLFR